MRHTHFQKQMVCQSKRGLIIRQPWHTTIHTIAEDVWRTSHFTINTIRCWQSSSAGWQNSYHDPHSDDTGGRPQQPRCHN
jgi:hypothetical protein